MKYLIDLLQVNFNDPLKFHQHQLWRFKIHLQRKKYVWPSPCITYSPRTARQIQQHRWPGVARVQRHCLRWDIQEDIHIFHGREHVPKCVMYGPYGICFFPTCGYVWIIFWVGKCKKYTYIYHTWSIRDEEPEENLLSLQGWFLWLY